MVNIDFLLDGKKIDTSKGFKRKNGAYIYQCKILDEAFTLTLRYTSHLEGQLYDNENQDEYYLPLIPGAGGDYIASVRKAVVDVLDSLVVENAGLPRQYKLILNYFGNKYTENIEYLWPDSPTSGIIRRKDNKKWYCVFQRIAIKKLGLDSDRIDYIVGFKTDDAQSLIAQNRGICPGFHMNKKRWASIVLDDTISDDELITLIDKSRDL